MRPDMSTWWRWRRSALSMADDLPLLLLLLLLVLRCMGGLLLQGVWESRQARGQQ
jgi:hypothetical protein